MTKTKPETQWIKAEMLKGAHKEDYFIGFPDAPINGFWCGKEQYDTLRAAQPSNTCDVCEEKATSYFCPACRKAEMDVSKDEGMAQGKKEADDKYKSRLTALEKRIKELGKCVI